MMRHRTCPRVQHRREADLRAETLRVGGDRQQRLRRCLEQEIVDHGLVLIPDGADVGRQREHDVEVGHLKQLGLTRLHPLAGLAALALRTMPIAAANGELTISCLMGSIYLWGVGLKMSEAVAFSRVPTPHYEPVPRQNYEAVDSRYDSLLASGGAKQHRENLQFSPPGRLSPSSTSGARFRWRGAVLWGVRGAEIVSNPRKHAKSCPELPIT